MDKIALQLDPQEWLAARKTLLAGEKGRPRRREQLRHLRRGLQKISVGVSLMILSLGFLFLGLVSLLNQPHGDLANVASAASISRIAGSTASLLASTIFLVASCIYWSRHSNRRGRKT
jgi:Mn2+/Fe2+ NRAMP family transporter